MEISRSIKQKSPQEEYDFYLKAYNDMEWKPFTTGNIRTIQELIKHLDNLATKFPHEIKTTTLKQFRKA